MKTGIVVLVIVIGLFLGGYVANIVKLCHCDFASPYKAEAIRLIGVFMPPIGIVTGYIEIDDSL